MYNCGKIIVAGTINIMSNPNPTTVVRDQPVVQPAAPTGVVPVVQPAGHDGSVGAGATSIDPGDDKGNISEPLDQPADATGIVPAETTNSDLLNFITELRAVTLADDDNLYPVAELMVKHYPELDQMKDMVVPDTSAYYLNSVDDYYSSLGDYFGERHYDTGMENYLLSSDYEYIRQQIGSIQHPSVKISVERTFAHWETNRRLGSFSENLPYMLKQEYHSDSRWYSDDHYDRHLNIPIDSYDIEGAFTDEMKSLIAHELSSIKGNHHATFPIETFTDEKIIAEAATLNINEIRVKYTYINERSIHEYSLSQIHFLGYLYFKALGTPVPIKTFIKYLSLMLVRQINGDYPVLKGTSLRHIDEYDGVRFLTPHYHKCFTAAYHSDARLVDDAFIDKAYEYGSGKFARHDKDNGAMSKSDAISQFSTEYLTGAPPR